MFTINPNNKSAFATLFYKFIFNKIINLTLFSISFLALLSTEKNIILWLFISVFLLAFFIVSHKRQVLINHYKNLTLLLLSALCMIFAYENNNIWPLAFFSPVLFYFVFHKQKISTKARIYYGFFYGALISLGGFYWLTYTLKVFGGMPLTTAYFLFVLYSFAFNLKFPIFFFLLPYTKKLKLPVWLNYAGLFTALEFFVIELFPWTFGASQYKNKYFIQAADIGGLYLITFLLIASSFWLLYAFKLLKIWKALSKRENINHSQKLSILSPFNIKFRSINRQFYFLTLLILANYSYGIYQYHNYSNKIISAQKVNVAMIQPSTSLGFKGYYSDKSSLRTIQTLVKRANKTALKANENISLFVIPEGAVHSISTNPSPGNPYYSKKFHRLLNAMIYDTNASFFLNEIDIDFKMKKSEATGQVRKQAVYYNSSSLIDVHGKRSEVYRKNFLLPFGEYIPLPEIWGLKKSVEKLFRNAGRFTKGDVKKIIPLSYYEDGKKQFPMFSSMKTDSFSVIQNQLLEENSNRKPNSLTYFIPVICYEILSGEYIRSFPLKKKAGFMVNVTNDRWFGDDSKASNQHMQLGLFRAIENRKGIIRNTNSGISAYIDARGTIDKSSVMKQTKKDFRIVSVAQMHSQTIYQSLGDWPPRFFAIVFILLFLKVYIFRRRKLNK